MNTDIDVQAAVVIVLLVLMLGCVGSIVYWSWHNGISPMPSTSKAAKCLLSIMPPLSLGIIYELGCGWGTLLVPIARRYPECTVVGYETSWIPYLFCRFLVYILRLPNVRVLRQDFLSARLDDASLVVCYLYPEAMRRLLTKFNEELKPGTSIVSNTFALPGMQPEKVVDIGDLYHSKVYVYRALRKL